VASYIERLKALQAGIGGKGARLLVKTKQFYADRVAATAVVNSGVVTVYTDVFFGEGQSDKSRIGYLVHEGGHAILGLTGQIGSVNDPTLKEKVDGRNIVLHPRDSSQVLGYRGPGASLAAQVGVMDHNDSFNCTLGFYRC